MKQVIIVNNLLKMPKGKLAAQVAHGAVGAFLESKLAARRAWLAEGMPKIVLSAPDAEALLRLLDQAVARGIPACLIEDAGHTVVAPGTLTCLGLGPAPEEVLDALTEDLKLL